MLFDSWPIIGCWHYSKVRDGMVLYHFLSRLNLHKISKLPLGYAVNICMLFGRSTCKAPCSIDMGEAEHHFLSQDSIVLFALALIYCSLQQY